MINVFDIERFATHDGDGIRTVVYLKGCMLRCPWCSNPESWKIEPELMFDQKKCSGCRLCEINCDSGAIYFKAGKFHYNKSINDLCQKSVEQCPTGALKIVGKSMSFEEILEVVMKDEAYYRNSGGGLTISGGEPFFQSAALLGLLKASKEKGLNVAIETTGNTELQHIQAAAPYIDTFLFDIKHLDLAKLKKVVGADGEKVMMNFECLATLCPEKVVIRVPVIPGFNDADDFLQQVLVLAKDAKVREVNLLPYHNLAQNKWEMLLKPFVMDEPMMDKNELKCWKAKGEAMGVRVKIGG